MIATHLTRQRTPVPAARELYSVVNRQLSDFRAADFESAYQHAAAGVQEKFSRSQFELMIRRDFSSLTQTAQVEFGAVRVAGAGALVPVYLTTPDGLTRAYLYSFTAERDGWKLMACSRSVPSRSAVCPASTSRRRSAAPWPNEWAG